MKISTNNPGATLTRPVSAWKRFLRFFTGIFCLLLALGSFNSGAGWVFLLPLLFGALAIAVAFQKTESIG